ncbi:MAG: hypothetical protein SOT72_03155 [Lactobacillus amylovorus]|uniref:hypothetical protein n=1 Tax=Lactobacillus amylovorus TaxID=1604 RepID=UPI00145EE597|nr:hypothetical protein [Lactobacillus amylovorus]MCI7161574.1 hypothetical protein [Lactobacillus amylovorus]MDY2786577.1 hypothetical protein [Lactobacillus amylovorus]MDY5445238.1 hypothetical protein [Lactobacillus amylovorus]
MLGLLELHKLNQQVLLLMVLLLANQVRTLVVMKHALLMKVNKFKDWKLLIIKKKL